ncbi:protein of unknown function [Brochothrix thermosphacta]|nr:hypothetical protein FM106_24545 [Brachybacterium faecium]SOC27825.1 hypothetical protein BTH160X_40083 [Brochothrix thermosphacta]SPN73032.1 protein of unknown function [Brochothrix thermosphacta]
MYLSFAYLIRNCSNNNIAKDFITYLVMNIQRLSENNKFHRSS